MSTKREIQKEIRDFKREMKERGVRVASCFNGGLSSLEHNYNARLFELKTKLERTAS